MPQENQSEIFIRLLGDALQADRLLRRSSTVRGNDIQAKRRQRGLSAQADDGGPRHAPLDCVQMMAAGLIGPQDG